MIMIQETAGIKTSVKNMKTTGTVVSGIGPDGFPDRKIRPRFAAETVQSVSVSEGLRTRSQHSRTRQPLK